MKKLISIFLLFCIFANMAFADCDFKTGITPLGDGTFKYSGECHRRVGDLMQDNKIKESQISDLSKAIELKDLAISKADQRTQLWMDTSYKLEDRLNKIDDLRSKNNWMYFGLGALTILGAGYLASQLVRR